MAKLEKWIAKKRYSIDRVYTEDGERLSVQVEIFSFTLEPVQRDDFDMLKEEFAQLQRMSRELNDEILLFNYSVFGTTSWSDQARKGLVFTQELRSDMVQSVSSLYDKINVLGHVSDDAGIKKSYLLAKDQLPVSVGSAVADNVECLLIHDDGMKNEHKIVKINRNPQNTVNIQEANGVNQQYAVYEFAAPAKGQRHCQIDDQKPYSLYVSKIAQVKA